ncbi:hypothetical protein AAFP30_19555 [Gordonia sp. CPCC 205515]|uniref:hypothetical protein n=1 Tax=Gordonia sp. CPCC 205515 TaxID=3140791 RepID=UPI003AF3BA3B
MSDSIHPSTPAPAPAAPAPAPQQSTNGAHVEHSTDPDTGHQVNTYVDAQGHVYLVEMDTDGDGAIDAAAKPGPDGGTIVGRDTDHDGKVDLVSHLDASGHIYEQDTLSASGQIESMLLDADGDGVPDVKLVDSDHDGRMDTTVLDVDHDGRPDTQIVDTDGDGQPDVMSYLNGGPAGLQSNSPDSDPSAPEAPSVPEGHTDSSYGAQDDHDGYTAAHYDGSDAHGVF